MDPNTALQLLLDAHRLKRTPRTGWALRGVADVESVADHSFGVAFTSLILAELVDQPLNKAKLLTIALLHDLPESVIGDLPTPATAYLPAGAKSQVDSSATPTGWTCSSRPTSTRRRQAIAGWRSSGPHHTHRRSSSAPRRRYTRRCERCATDASSRTMWTPVWNETRGERLLAHVYHCTSFPCRLRGLTFRRRLGADEGLLLVGSRESRAEAAIHMFFVFFPIAVIWLDAERRVVDKKLARPFRPYYAPQRPAQYFLECHPHALDKVEIGHQVTF
jgi:uncharacterized membrane protein (UPF0127 family)